MKTTQRSALYAILFAVSCGAYVACGDSGGDTGTTGNPQPVGSSSSGGTTTMAGTGGAGGSGTSSSTTGTGGTGTGGSGGCYSGTPSTNDQYLNACNGMTCNNYDNKAHLPLLNADGSLPPLP